MKGELFVSIVIPSLIADITACLESMYRQTHKDFEVIVVNYSSSKRHLRLLDETQINIVHEPIQGSYAARKRGIKQAKGEYVIFTEADCIAHENWLKELNDAVKANNADMVLGHIQQAFSIKRINCERVNRDIYHDHQILFSRGMRTTANLLISKGLLQETIGFSTGYFSGRDIDCVKIAMNSPRGKPRGIASVPFHSTDDKDCFIIGTANPRGKPRGILLINNGIQNSLIYLTSERNIPYTNRLAAALLAVNNHP